MQVLSWFQAVVDFFLHGLQWLFGMARHADRRFYWIAHLVVIVVITVVLAYFSQSIADPKWLRTFPLVKKFYVAICFQVLYWLIRLTIYLVQLWREKDVAAFPDIDEAWFQGLDALARAGLRIEELPLFLVLGLTGTQISQFFTTAKFRAKAVGPDPSRPAALYFFANDESLFIACPGVSSASRQASTLDDWPGPGASSDPDPPPAFSPGQTMNTPMAPMGTLRPSEINQITGTLLKEAAQESARKESRIRPLTADVLDLCRRRLEYFCRLLSEARAPWCPINGLALSIPLEYGSTNKMMSLFPALQQDLRVTHKSLKMLFPIVCFFDGLQDLAGFGEFSQRLEKRVLSSRAGSRFPLGHVVDDLSSDWVISRSLQWFRNWVYSEFAKDHAHASNAKLYRLLCALDDYRQRLITLLKAILGDVGTSLPPRLAGTYFMAGGKEASTIAFVEGVLPRLLEEQNNVAWTPAAVQADSGRRTGAIIGFVLIAVLIVANGWVFWWGLDKTPGKKTKPKSSASTVLPMQWPTADLCVSRRGET